MNGGPFTAPQLKIIAEICSLTTFAIFSSIVLKEKLRWVDLGAFSLILAGVLLSLLTKPATSVPPLPPVPESLPPPPPTADVQIAPPPPGGNRKLMVDGELIINGDPDIPRAAVTIEVILLNREEKPTNQ
jgi:hypothetical protein